MLGMGWDVYLKLGLNGLSGVVKLSVEGFDVKCGRLRLKDVVGALVARV
jgi:hypothetical protein